MFNTKRIKLHRLKFSLFHVMKLLFCFIVSGPALYKSELSVSFPFAFAFIDWTIVPVEVEECGLDGDHS